MTGMLSIPDRDRATNYLRSFLSAACYSETSVPFVKDERVMFMEMNDLENPAELPQYFQILKEMVLNPFEEIHQSFNPAQPANIRLRGLTFLKKGEIIQTLESVQQVFERNVGQTLTNEFCEEFRTAIREIDQTSTSLCLSILMDQLEMIRNRLKSGAEICSTRIQKEVAEYQSQPASIERLKQSLDNVNQILKMLKIELKEIFKAIHDLYDFVVPQTHIVNQNDSGVLKKSIDVSYFKPHLKNGDISAEEKQRFSELITEITQEIVKIYSSLKPVANDVKKCRDENFEVADYRFTTDGTKTFEELFSAHQVCLFEGVLEVNDICEMPDEECAEDFEDSYSFNKALYAIALLKCYQKKFLKFRATDNREGFNPELTEEWMRAKIALQTMYQKEEYAPYFIEGQPSPKIVIDGDLWMFDGLQITNPHELCKIAPSVRRHDKILYNLCRLLEDTGFLDTEFSGVISEPDCMRYPKMLAEIDLYILGFHNLPPIPKRPQQQHP